VRVAEHYAKGRPIVLVDDTWCDNELEITDETGTARLCLKHAEMLLNESKFHTPPARTPLPHFKQLLRERYGVEKKRWLTSLFYTEAVLAVGDVVYVFGNVEVNKPRPTFSKPGGLFLLSNFDERKLSRRLRLRAWWPLVRVLLWIGIIMFVMLLFLLAWFNS
jgi:hypothetical protein